MKLSRLRQILLEIEEDATDQSDPDVLFWVRRSTNGLMSPVDHDIGTTDNFDDVQRPTVPKHSGEVRNPARTYLDQ